MSNHQIEMYQEYDSVTSRNVNTSINSCYSNMKAYGCEGRYNKIIPPTPVTVQPWMFNYLQPHNYNVDQFHSNKPNSLRNCTEYARINQK